MENLVFSKEGRYYVTEPLVPNDEGTVAFQIGVNSNGAILTVERRLDESLPWAKVSSIPLPRMPETYCDRVVGFEEGDIVRFKLNHKPAISAVL